MKRNRMVGRASVRTGRLASPFDALSLAQGRPARYGWPPEQIENENDDEDEKDCSKHRATLKAVGRG
jgi:hypothetical protein